MVVSVPKASVNVTLSTMDRSQAMAKQLYDAEIVYCVSSSVMVSGVFEIVIAGSFWMASPGQEIFLIQQPESLFGN